MSGSITDVLHSLQLRLGALRQALSFATAFYLDGQDEFNLTARRQAATHALRALIEFLETVDDFNQLPLTLPLEGLLSALVEAEKGTADPLLKPQRPDHRPPDTEFETHLKAYAAVAMSLLMAFGDKEQQAGETVAKALAEGGYRLQGDRRPRGTTIRNWRAKCIGHHGSSCIGKTYDRLLARLETARMVNRETANSLLGGLASFVRERNILKPPS